MMATRTARHGLAAALALLAFLMPAPAQQPSPSALATAKELLELKGAWTMFDPLVPGVIEAVKNSFLPTHPSLAKQLNEVAAQLRTELAARRNEVMNEIAMLYAQRFSEAEMKGVIAFYKTPIGKKFLLEEPAVVDQSLAYAQAWSNKLSEEVIARFRTEMKKKGFDL